MASWSQLPSDFKKSVVDHLDVFSRNRLKICSTSDRKLVNSVPLTIKNARIGISDTSCLLVIHTGIDEFLKINLKKVKDGIVVRRSVNIHDFKDAPWIPTEHKDILVALCLFMKSLLTNSEDNIFLEAFEWELSEYWLSVQLSEELRVLLKNVFFRTKRLVFDHMIRDVFIKSIAFRCMKADLKFIEKRSLSVYAHDSKPFYTLHTFYPNFYFGLTLRASRTFLNYVKLEGIMFLMLAKLSGKPDNSYVTLSAYRQNQAEIEFDPKYPIQRLNEHVTMQRYIKNNAVFRTNKSSCGFWTTVIRASKENTVNWAAETCGFHDYCSKCFGDFASNYFLNLPRRVALEPEWMYILNTKLLLSYDDPMDHFLKLEAFVKRDIEQDKKMKEEAEEKRRMEEVKLDSKSASEDDAKVEVLKSDVEDENQDQKMELMASESQDPLINHQPNINSEADLMKKMDSTASESEANHALNHKLNTESTANARVKCFNSKTQKVEVLKSDIEDENQDQNQKMESTAFKSQDLQIDHQPDINSETDLVKALGTFENPRDSTSSNISKFLLFSLFLIICISTPTILAFTIWPLLPDNVQSAISSFFLFLVNPLAYLINLI